MRRLLLLGLALVLAASAARASEWGGIRPGVTTVAQVRERYGAPSTESRPRVEGYDTQQFVYEGSKAPAGIQRMTVDFGLLTPGGYRPELVRIFTLEPHPSIFGRATVVQGWGVPDGVSTAPDGAVTLFWKAGLLVALDREGYATSMIFTVPQPDVPVSSSTPGPTAPAQPR
jgi:hypothetical protein